MESLSYQDALGKKVKYYDYIGDERFGTIVEVEPCDTDEASYVYIEDDDPDYNIHEDVVNGRIIKYAEICMSTEVYLDE